MQEVFEKIIERLEESGKAIYREPTVEDPPVCSLIPTGEKDILVSKAIEIVNQVESEYNNGACEWKLEENTGIVWHCSDEKCSTYNDSYIKNLRIVLEDFECICPYCGKRIEVVE